MEGVMVSVATGVMNSLLDKLSALLGKEFKLHSRVKHDIAFLKDELSCMNALLEKLGNMEVLDLQVKEWRKQRVKELVGHHGVAQQINELKDRVVEAKHRRKRYKVANEVDPGTNNVLSIDPRLSALYVESSDLVGIDIPRDHLINMLDDGEQSLKAISIVGLGGSGKTTLANEAYKRISWQFDCKAFVSVSQKPDVLYRN
nr:unnamed protein product [Digitaria exilis]